jgi:hypothetical protein
LHIYQVSKQAKKYGYRSGLEYKLSLYLKKKKCEYSYESIKIESKGRFLAADRRKHLAIQKQHPNLDIRFVFTNSRSRLSKGAKSTYAQWCIKYGFRYYDRIVPEDWLKEKGKNEHPVKIKFTGIKLKGELRYGKKHRD